MPLALAGVLLAGGGGGGSDDGDAAGRSPSPSTTPGNGVADLEPKAIIEKATAA